MQLCSSLSIFWHCLSLGLEWKLTFSSPVATAEFSKFADILSAALSCPSLCNPVDCSTPSLPVHHHSQSLLKLMSIESVKPSKHLILCHLLLLPPSNFLTSESFLVSQFFASGGQSTGISSPLLPLFVVILPKAHLTSHSRMSGSRWVITPSWLSGLWRSFLYMGTW